MAMAGCDSKDYSLGSFFNLGWDKKRLAPRNKREYPKIALHIFVIFPLISEGAAFFTPISSWAISIINLMMIKMCQMPSSIFRTFPASRRFFHWHDLLQHQLF